MHIHMHIHTHIYIYIHIYMAVSRLFHMKGFVPCWAMALDPYIPKPAENNRHNQAGREKSP